MDPSTFTNQTICLQKVLFKNCISHIGMNVGLLDWFYWLFFSLMIGIFICYHTRSLRQTCQKSLLKFQLILLVYDSVISI